MALTFLVILHAFNVSSFTKSNCHDFIVNDECPPVHPTSVHWIITFGGNAGVLSQAETKAKKTVCKFKDALKLFGLSYQRKSLTTL